LPSQGSADLDAAEHGRGRRREAVEADAHLNEHDDVQSVYANFGLVTEMGG
jgi:hypothetical protein